MKSKDCVFTLDADGKWYCGKCDKKKKHPEKMDLRRNCPFRVRLPRHMRQPKEKNYLGDVLEKALTAIGVTKDRIEVFLGHPCGCVERQRKLNELHRWALVIAKGKMRGARWRLNHILTRKRKRNKRKKKDESS